MYFAIRHFWWLIGLGIAGSLGYNALVPIHFDEAYYWSWSKQLAAGYFDHPPMVSYLIWLTTFFSDQVFWVRLGAIVCTLGSLWFFYKWVCDTHNLSVARLATLMLASLPLVQVNATIITPDAPLALFWSLGLFASWRALERERLGYWYLTGFAIGLMVASKLIAIFFILPFVLYILCYRRDVFACIHVYLAALVSLLPVLPMLYWNSENDWLTFSYQLARANAENTFPNYRALGEFLTGVTLVLTPLVLVLVGFGLYQRWRGRIVVAASERFALVFSLVIFGFFLYKSTESIIFHNWYGHIVFTLIPLVASDLFAAQRSKITIAAITVALLLVVLLRFPSITGLGWSSLKHNYGYPLAIAEFADDLQPGEVVCSDYYTMSAMLRYYLRDGWPVITRFSIRKSQFDLWQQADPVSCRGLIYRGSIPKRITQGCYSLSEQRELRYTLDSSYAPRFQTFVCDLQS